MTKPNRRAEHHISYAQINLFPFKFYRPPHILPKSQKNEKEKHVALKHWERTSTVVLAHMEEERACGVNVDGRHTCGVDLDGGHAGGVDLDGGRVVEAHMEEERGAV
jgi:hypothetical protein